MHSNDCITQLMQFSKVESGKKNTGKWKEGEAD